MFILLIVVVAIIVLSLLFELSIWIGIALLALTVLLSIFSVIIYPKLQWRKWRYEVHDSEIDIQHGVFIIRRTLIPMVRVQHVDTQQGPLLRKFNLSSVTISTAATIHEIPALDVAEADVLRDRISTLARVTDYDE
jgi:membrane protein YdbS with pleckstrin-like domain